MHDLLIVVLEMITDVIVVLLLVLLSTVAGNREESFMVADHCYGCQGDPVLLSFLGIEGSRNREGVAR